MMPARYPSSSVTIDGALPLPAGAATDASTLYACAKLDTLILATNALTAKFTLTAAGLKVDGSAITQPVSGIFWPAVQAVSVGNFPVSQAVTGVFFPALQPVSVAALPLPTGASTEATLAAILARLPLNAGSLAFGKVDTAAITRVPVMSPAYVEQTVGAQRSIVSNNTFDGPFFGTGYIKITYLTSTGAGPFTEVIAPNGVTPVNTVATNICFIEKVEVLGPSIVVGGGGIFGTISIMSGVGGTGTLIATISGTDQGRTAWAHHYVPVGKTCRLVSVSVGSTATTAGGGALFTLTSRAISGTNVFEPIIDEYISLEGSASSTDTRYYSFPLLVVGPARIICYVTPNNTATNTQRAAFEFVDT